jgi:pyruvate dehydrogenase E2 component (dihydrolipoamide acetyltransferase)
MDFTLPSLGADMESATFVKWLVEPGQRVERGQPVCVVETQKGAIDVEIWQSGTVRELFATPGASLPVGAVLARLEPDAEVESPPATPSAAGAPLVSIAPNVITGVPFAPAEPAGQPARPRASPSARRRAAELGLDLAGLAGTGPGGVVSLADVERAVSAPAPAALPASGAPAMRAAIAAAMTRSKREIPHYYLGHHIRVDRALDWMEQHNRSCPLDERLLFAAVCLRAVALALREVPELNGHHVDGVFRPGEGIHVGVAVALRGGGLIAPGIRDVDRLSMGALMSRLKDLLGRARDGQLRSSELTSPTITVTSLGELGVDTVYGVIHPPQVAIVGLGRVAPQPWVAAGQVIAARVMHTTLSADHRVSDGLRGARFQAHLDALLQDPEAL